MLQSLVVLVLVLLVPQVQMVRLHAIFNVKAYGAKGDGQSNDSDAIATTFAAAAAASASGASVTVLLPGPGTYLVDQPLVFNASHAALIVESGAILRWQWDKELAFATGWAQGGGRSATMLTFAPSYTTSSTSPGGHELSSILTNVSISGGGLLDGQGFMWWPFRYHVYEYIHSENWPPYFITFSNIQELAVTNITILDPPMIAVQTCGTDDVTMSHMNISASWLTPDEFYDPVSHGTKIASWRFRAPVTAGGVGANGTCGSPGMDGGRVWHDKPNDPRCEPPNTDGIDPGCGSRNVHIHDVFIENGDDSIVMKQGWPRAGQLPPDGCTRDVLVERVTIFRGMGTNIGGLGDGCVENVTFKDILLDHPSLNAVEIKTENGKDNRSFISNILYQNITVKNSLNAPGFPCVEITASYSGDGHGYAGQNLPKISNVSFRDIDLRGCSTPITMKCNASQPCEAISFDSIVTGEAFVCENVDCTAVNVTRGMADCCK